jgi:hypothetical protein
VSEWCSGAPDRVRPHKTLVPISLTGSPNEPLTVTVAQAYLCAGLLTVSKTSLLRFAIWASLALAALFQTAFLLELHSPLPSDSALWSLSILSVGCVAVFLHVRRSLAAKANISYGPERVYRQRHSGDGAEYWVQGVYCVILYRQPRMHCARTKCLYLSEGSADRAVRTASIESPQWLVIGVEPSNLSARMPQSDRSHPTSDTWHVA